jgi:hypothetical protein
MIQEFSLEVYAGRTWWLYKTPMMSCVRREVRTAGLTLRVILATAMFAPVADFARVHSLQSRVYLPRGLAGRLDCPTDANPPTTHVTWSKNERIIIETTFTTSATSRFKVSRQGSLIIRPVEPDDEGRYTCTPTSSLGGGQQSTPIQVFVRGNQILSCWLLKHVLWIFAAS